MKHYVGPARYSTQNIPISASTKPIDIGFLSDTISTTIAINKRHQDAENKQIAQEQANAEKEQAAVAAQMAREQATASRIRDNEIAAVQKQLAKNQNDFQKYKSDQAKDRMAIQKDFIKAYNNSMKQQEAEYEQQEKDFNNAWGRDQMALFRSDVGEMKDYYKMMYGDEQVRDLMNNRGYEMYDPWTGGWT